MKPGRSDVRTGCFPNFLTNAIAESKTSWSVTIVRITSTNSITGTGFIKWTPMNRCGRLVAIIISVIEIEEVLLARMASFLRMGSRARHRRFFSSILSMMASMTMSQFASFVWSVVTRRRPSMAVFSGAFSEPFWTARSSRLTMFPNPRSHNSCVASTTTVGNPEAAHTWAIPEPISPHPTTPISRISIAVPLVQICRGLPRDGRWFQKLSRVSSVGARLCQCCFQAIDQFSDSVSAVHVGFAHYFGNTGSHCKRDARRGIGSRQLPHLLHHKNRLSAGGRWHDGRERVRAVFESDIALPKMRSKGRRELPDEL